MDALGAIRDSVSSPRILGHTDWCSRGTDPPNVRLVDDPLYLPTLCPKVETIQRKTKHIFVPGCSHLCLGVSLKLPFQELQFHRLINFTTLEVVASNADFVVLFTMKHSLLFLQEHLYQSFQKVAPDSWYQCLAALFRTSLFGQSQAGLS